MANAAQQSGPRTTRDQLEKLFDILRRTLRYWWLVAIIGITGAALSVILALQQDHVYQSETVLLYQEKISQSVLQGKEIVESSRKMAERYEEMLLSRSNLSRIVEEFSLFPDIVGDKGTVAAAEELRKRIKFKDSGAGTIRISYQGDSRKEAQVITARLAELLKEQDDRVRRERAEQTKAFLGEEKRAAEIELKKRETELARFLAANPEFVADTGAGGSGSSSGASIRAAQAKGGGGGNPQLLALERQRRRIQARLANPEGVIVSPTVTPRNASPELKQAQKHVQDAEREVAEALQRFTAKHPDVISAQNRLAAAKRQLRRVEAEEAALAGRAAPPPIRSEVDRDELQRQLSRIEGEIARVRSEAAAEGKGEKSSLADQLVNLETEYTRLSRWVDEGRERLEALENRMFTAEITASSEFADAAQLVVIDEAFLPATPAGRGRKLIAIAGTMVFGLLGVALALGLALIDDRIYRRQDLDELGIAPVLAVIPKKPKRRVRRA